MVVGFSKSFLVAYGPQYLLATALVAAMGMNRVLITGACGFVGRHLTKRLLALGVHVTLIDALSTGKPLDDWLPVKTDPSYEFHQVDVRDYFRFALDENFDHIFHCAAVVGGRLKIDGDPIAVATDLAIDADMFQWIVKLRKRPKLIYFSSSAAYPITYQQEHEAIPLSETMIDFSKLRFGIPDMSYGWSKLTGELLAQYAAKKYDLDVVCYRPFSGYGEDQSLDYPFPALIKRVKDKENPITIWGSGQQQRDFIHIDDVVDCVLATKDKLGPAEALNIGTGIATSFFDLAGIAVRLSGRYTPIKTDPAKPEGVFSRVSDPFKMKQWFTPTISLEQGVARALDREQKQL